MGALSPHPSFWFQEVAGDSPSFRKANAKSSRSNPCGIAEQSKEINTLFGDSIVVTGVYRGKSAKDGKVIVIRGRSTGPWARINGNWQCVEPVHSY